MTPSEELIRRVDWRFLLPDPRPRTAIVVARDPQTARGVSEALGLLDVAVVDSDTRHATVDLVFARDAHPAAFGRALERRNPDGAIAVETTSRRSRVTLALRLRRAGLRVQHYGAWPVCASATRFVAMDARSELVANARAAKNPRRRAIGSLLARAGFGSVLFREATTVATNRRADRPGPLRIAFGDDAPGGTMTLLTPRFGSSRHVIAMCTDERGRHLVVKSPRVPTDDAQLALEAQGLSAIEGPLPARPMLAADTERFGQRWLVQTRLDGPPLTRHDVAEDPARWLAAARAWLDLMPTGGRSAPDVDGRLDRLVGPALAVITSSAARDPAIGRLVDDAQAACRRLHSVPLPIAAEHGDFRPPNLIVDETGALGAVDWELAERFGFPLHDLFFFHAFVLDVAPHSSTTVRAAERDAGGALGVDPDVVDALRSIALLRQLANLIERGTVTDGISGSDVARAWFAELDRRCDTGRTTPSEIAP